MFTYWTVLESGEGRYPAPELRIYERYPLQKDSSVKDHLLSPPSTQEEGHTEAWWGPSCCFHTSNRFIVTTETAPTILFLLKFKSASSTNTPNYQQTEVTFLDSNLKGTKECRYSKLKLEHSGKEENLCNYDKLPRGKDPLHAF